MSTLVISLETVGQDWEDLSEKTKNSLTGWMENKNLSEDEKTNELKFIKSNLALSPFTGEIISIALYDVERELSVTYILGEDNISSELFKNRTEKEMIEDFWEGVKGYDTFVTFNGRAFTLPFLWQRSAILKIKTTVEIAKERYVNKQAMPYHIDLLDEFTFHGAMPKRPSLDLLCEVYGIEAEKQEESEADMHELFQQKKFMHIAKNNQIKVQKIKALYEIWQQNFAPLSFLNTLD